MENRPMQINCEQIHLRAGLVAHHGKADLLNTINKGSHQH